jgi:hypothetical protein
MSASPVRLAGWQFARGQRKGGPVSFEQLQKWASAGKLLPSDHVLEPGAKEWRTADLVPGLFSGIRQGLPPAPEGTLAGPPPAAVPIASDEPPSPAQSSYVALILIGTGAFFFLALGAVLFVVCVLGDRGRSKEDSAPEESASRHESPRPALGKVKILPPLTPRQKEINAAVERGVAYLRKRIAEGSKFYAIGDQQSSGHPGAMALVGLTLLECGAAANDPDVQEAAALVRNHSPHLPLTYSIAASILFLDRLYAEGGSVATPADHQLIRTLALRLVAGQNSNAGWDYYCNIIGHADETKLLGRLQNGKWQVGEKFVNVTKTKRTYYDNSIGQFVTLALWAARKHDVPVRAPLLAVAARYRAQQNPQDGSWSYNDQNPFLRDTSTCAALIGLAVGRAIQDQGQGGGADLLEDPVVQSGLRHLEKTVGTKNRVSAEEFARKQKRTFDMEILMRQLEDARDEDERKNLVQQLTALDNARELRGLFFDGDDWGDLYLLWSLERMAVIYDLKKLGEVDWHEWGTDVILPHQQPDGSWSERFPGVPDTCFALLFLKRANIVKDLTDKLRSTVNRPGVDRPPAPGRRD